MNNQLLFTLKGVFFSSLTFNRDIITSRNILTRVAPVPQVVLIVLCSLLFATSSFAQAPGGVTANLSLWLIGDKASTSIQDANVSQWDDQSGNGLHATQGTVDNQPYYQAANGVNAINFHGTILFSPGGEDRYLSSPDNAVFETTNRSVYAVSKAPHGGNSDYRVIVSRKENDNWDNGWILTGTGSDMAYEHGQWDDIRDAEALYAPYPNNIPFITSAESESTTQRLGINGAAFISNTTSQTTRGSEYQSLNIGIAQGGWGTDNYIAEIVYYNSNNSSERLRIESYLALKYGLTLDQSSPQNYLASDGSTIWNASVNSGYDNDIFGIARDDASGLDQRVSKSVNDTTVVTLSLDNDFTTANIDTTASGHEIPHTNDIQYLVLGSNDADVTFTASTEMPAGYNARMDREWYVQKTDNFTQDVYLQFDSCKTSGNAIYYMLIDTDNDGGDFTNAATAYELDANGVTTTAVNLPDNAYITVVSAVVSPGGIVADLKLWLRADKGPDNTTDGGQVATWNDQSPVANDFTQGDGAYQPFYKINTGEFNFNPALDFVNTSVLYGIQNLGTGTGVKIDLIAVVNTENTDFSGIVMAGERGADRDISLNVTAAGEFLVSKNIGTSGDLISTSGLQGTTPAIVYGGYTGPGVIAAVNGEAFTSLSVSSDITAQTFRIGEGGLDGEFYDGRIAEVIAYNANNDVISRQKIESYLALKYGITLNSGTVDYLASDSTRMWDASDAEVNSVKFNHDIFGIGLDSVSMLDQRVSKSINDSAIVTISSGIADFKTTNLSTTRMQLNNLAFETIGNNGGDTVWVATNAPQRFVILNRVWQVQEADSVGNVYLQFDVEDNKFNVAKPPITEKYYIVVDRNGDGDFSDDIPIALKQSITDSNLWYTESPINFVTGQLFTLASWAESKPVIMTNGFLQPRFFK